MSASADQAGRSRLIRNATAVVLALLLVAAFVMLVLELRGDDEQSAAGDRDAAILAARSYVEAASNFGPDDLDDQQLLTGYRERVEPLIADSYEDDFAEEVTNVTPLAAQGYGVTTSVDRAGVSEIDDDRAKVLVGGETARSLKDKTEEPQGYTLEISLVRRDGEWLVDQAPCNVVQDPTCEAPANPAEGVTPAPSDQPTQPQGKSGKKSKDDGPDARRSEQEGEQ